jgi:hypothetical protein
MTVYDVPSPCHNPQTHTYLQTLKRQRVCVSVSGACVLSQYSPDPSVHFEIQYFLLGFCFTRCLVYLIVPASGVQLSASVVDYLKIQFMLLS